MKKCYRCKITKPLMEFSRDKSKSHGRCGLCKLCDKIYSRDHYLRNRDVTIQKRQEYYAENHQKVIDCNRAYRENNRTEIREKIRIRYRDNPHRSALKIKAREWRYKNTEKAHAHEQLNYAVKKGVVIRPDICSRCGDGGTVIHGHHDDYEMPLIVRWVCPPCHNKIHRDKIK